MVIFRWPGPNFGSKIGQKIRANDTNIAIECAKPGANQRGAAKKVVAGPGGYKPIKIIQVDAFGVALNPMVESEWMFGRNVFLFHAIHMLHRSIYKDMCFGLCFTSLLNGVIIVILSCVMSLFTFKATCLLARCDLTL